MKEFIMGGTFVTIFLAIIIIYIFTSTFRLSKSNWSQGDTGSPYYGILLESTPKRWQVR